MSHPQAPKLEELTVIIETTAILRTALEQNDDNQAHEAVSVMLMQVVTLFGMESPILGHFFPVMDVIKRRIDAMDLVGALEQTEIFDRQLHEIVEMVKGF